MDLIDLQNGKPQPKLSAPELQPSRLLQVGRPEPDFKVFTTALKGFIGDDGQKRIKGTASSTIKDLHGDRMSESAITQMASTAGNNMTIFLNHSYDLPEDIFGSVESVTVMPREGYIDLDFQIVVDENPRAVQTYGAIERGRKLGISIGGLVEKWSEDKTDQSWIIDDILLLEASIVSIPANPRSWVEQAVKSIVKRYSGEDVEEHVEGFGDMIARKALQLTVDANARRDRRMKMAGLVEDEEPETQNETPEEQNLAPAPELLQACPSCGRDRYDTQGCGDDFHKESPAPEPGGESADPAELATEASDLTNETTDAVDSAQEAPQSDPGAAINAEADPEMIQKQAEAALFSGQLATSAVSLIKRLLDAYLEARSQRDQYAADLEVAKQIVEGMMALPVGRKTAFMRVAGNFRSKMSHIYGDDFVALIDQIKRGN